MRLTITRLFLGLAFGFTGAEFGLLVRMSDTEWGMGALIFLFLIPVSFLCYLALLAAAWIPCPDGMSGRLWGGAIAWPVALFALAFAIPVLGQLVIVIEAVAFALVLWVSTSPPKRTGDGALSDAVGP